MVFTLVVDQCIVYFCLNEVALLNYINVITESRDIF